KPGMELPFGAAHTDVREALRTGLHYVAQHARRLRTDMMREGITAFGTMLDELGVSAAAIDHVIPELPGIQYAEIALEHASAQFGLRRDAWRFDVPEIGNVGGATFPIVLDRLARRERLTAGDLIVSFAAESSNWMFAGAALRWAS